MARLATRCDYLENNKKNKLQTNLRAAFFFSVAATLKCCCSSVVSVSWLVKQFTRFKLDCSSSEFAGISLTWTFRIVSSATTNILHNVLLSDMSVLSFKYQPHLILQRQTCFFFLSNVFKCFNCTPSLTLLSSCSHRSTSAFHPPPHRRFKWIRRDSSLGAPLCPPPKWPALLWDDPLTTGHHGEHTAVTPSPEPSSPGGPAGTSAGQLGDGLHRERRGLLHRVRDKEQKKTVCTETVNMSASLSCMILLSVT